VSTSTDLGGHFELDLPAAGAWQVTVAAPAHSTLSETETIAANQEVQVVYRADRTDFSDYRTVVHVKPVREEVSRTTLAQEEVQYIPGTNGDAIRAVTTLPGLARPPFGSGYLIIQGSAPADSAVFINGGLILQLFHFGALASVFNSDIIDHIDYLPSNFSARYGRVTGGIVDVVSKPGRKDGFHGYGDLNAIDGSALLEGPVGQGSFAVAARRSIIDLWLPLLLNKVDAGITESPVYYDYQGELSQPLLGGNFNVLAFGSEDQTKLTLHDPSAVDPAIRGQFETDLYFHYLQPSWDYQNGNFTVHAFVQTGPSHQEFAIGPELSLHIDSWDTWGRLDLGERLSPMVKLEGGLDVGDNAFHVNINLPHPPMEGGVMQPLSGQTFVHVDERSSSFMPAAWYQLDVEPIPGLLLMPGARVDYHSYINKWSLDPRFAFRWTVHKGTTIKGGVGMFHEVPQPPYFIDRFFGNPDLPYKLAYQTSLGVEEQFTPDLYADVTGFYKSLSDFPLETTDLIDRGGMIVPEWYAPTRAGRVYGVQVLARKELTDRWFGWIAYTLSKTERWDGPGKPVFPFTFDQTHILTVLASYKITPTWQFGARVLYSTGNVFTPVLGSVYNADADVYIPIPGPEDSLRLPGYFELDLRLDKRWVFDSWILDAYLDVRNVTNRANVEAFTYNYDYSQRTTVQGLPIIPSLGVKGQF
jgi:hypothetical protein